MNRTKFDRLVERHQFTFFFTIPFIAATVANHVAKAFLA